MISVQNLTKRISDVPVIKGLSFEISTRSVVGLLGPNGAGKTTTIRILTTLLSPSSGRALISGFDTVEAAPEVRKRLGYLPEHPPLYLEMRVHDYLKTCGQLRELSGAKLISAIERVSQICQIESVLPRFIGHLSKGFRQRVGIAQAIIHEPEVVILDEPTSGLDPIQLIETRRLIKSLGESATVLLSSHLLTDIIETCSRAVLIAGGELRFDGAISDLENAKALEDKFLTSVFKA